jgi:hypothetical protein
MSDSYKAGFRSNAYSGTRVISEMSERLFQKEYNTVKYSYMAYEQTLRTVILLYF